MELNKQSSVSKLRDAGLQEYSKYRSKNENESHYKTGNIEPIELIRSLGVLEGFCTGNIIKYASRHNQTFSQTDLLKIIDYALILLASNREV